MRIKLLNFKENKLILNNLSNPLYKNSFFMALSRIFDSACGFLFWMIAAKFYTIEEVGLATALVSSLGLVLLFSRLGFDVSMIRFFPYENKVRILGTSLSITSLASLLVGIAYILLAEFLSSKLVFLKEPRYALIFLLVGVLNSMANITGLAFVGDRKANHFFFQHIFMALRIPLLIPLAFLGFFGIMGSLGLAFFVAISFSLITLRRILMAIRFDVDMDFIWRSMRFSSRNYAVNILNMGPILILPIMVLNMLGEVEAAKFYIAYAIGNIVLIIPSSMATSLLVEGSHGMRLKKSAFMALSASFSLLVPMVLLINLFGDRLLGMLGPEYLEAFDLLKLLSLSSFLVTLYSMFVPIQNVRMRAESVLQLNIIRCVLLIGLSYVLIGQYGVLGVGYSWMITYGIIIVMIGGIARRENWRKCK